MSGTLLGYVFNKALSKSIPVYITESGPGWAMCGLIIAPSVSNVRRCRLSDIGQD
ncbi:hypothetical protein AJ79_09790 [Helicocarpus griseus UAMH5409]|uniref:Uncharacterized protein n=1 Tax=Helicocarpus griseus UAMH5409 TaxID=1447875 RepID=A0A2B7WHK7_9EURO|nr:hypothetical protein AJ79_09790 [Helicocarpus griseus UAMH5409]